jgi:hypothetical protein
MHQIIAALELLRSTYLMKHKIREVQSAFQARMKREATILGGGLLVG